MHKRESIVLAHSLSTHVPKVLPPVILPLGLVRYENASNAALPRGLLFDSTGVMLCLGLLHATAENIICFKLL